ncbi:MAG: AAA family ATPase [Haliscomenobacter sp.]|nr:AAA family ATPase [Haliscomenobacter sp.]
MLKLEKPLLLEGNPGVGKTRIAYILSELLDYELARLQCYEGLDVNNAIYEWNYQKQIPLVVLTSNRTRELSDALKRRCLYHWVNYPSMDKEIRIIKKHLPDIEERLAEQIASYVDRIRNLKLDKAPGIAETIDWARGIALLNGSSEAMVQSLACLLKSDHDIKRVMEDIF